MTTVIVDASVAIKWLLNEPLSAQADRLLQPPYRLHAPRLLLPEVGNALWKRARRGDLGAASAQEGFGVLLALPVLLLPDHDVVPDALTLALTEGRPIYDCVYLALAIRNDLPFITADVPLSTSLKSAAARAHVVALSDIRV
jgi:predicted nucleic acid-binding protein